MKKQFIPLCFLFVVIFSVVAESFAQDNTSSANNLGEIHGNMQMDAQYYNPDSTIGATPVPEKMLMNGFANINYTKGKFSAGIRYESYLNAIQGYPSQYKGNGIPYRYASYKADELEVTAGNFYEQFGSGMILRAYEEKGLGIDNVFDGLRLKYSLNGIYVKGLIGKQRSYFTQGPGIVRGVDGEIHVCELVKKWNESRTQVVIGGSFVSKFQSGNKMAYGDSTLSLPENVGAWAERISISRGKINLTGEYAYKINDPASSNNFNYRPGEAVLVNGNYSTKGFALSLGAKRIDNFSFKSDRTANLSDLNINFLPALSRQHTYSLFAFYPYSTQPNGEIAYRAELSKKFKKETKLGGKFGTDIMINFSRAHGLDITPTIEEYDTSRIGYVTNSFNPGKLYFSDLNIELVKKLSPKLKIMLLYANQAYNKDVIQGKNKYGIIYSNIAMYELTYKISSSKSIRWELQHMWATSAHWNHEENNTTPEKDEQNWVMSLVEVGLGEHWLVSAVDMYNYGNDDSALRLHYYNFSAVYVKNAMRVSLGYGRQREGIFCVGGVCRYVPASNGIMLSVTSSF